MYDKIKLSQNNHNDNVAVKQKTQIPIQLPQNMYISDIILQAIECSIEDGCFYVYDISDGLIKYGTKSKLITINCDLLNEIFAFLNLKTLRGIKINVIYPKHLERYIQRIQSDIDLTANFAVDMPDIL